MGLAGVPRLGPTLIERARLTARFEDDLPLVLAHAPIGSGKTVAMAHWAHGTERPGVWMRVADGVSSAQTFVTQFAVTLADLGMLPHDNPLIAAADALRYGSGPIDLLTRGLRRLPGPLTLALDEADALDDDTLRGLLRVLEDVPAFSLRATARRPNPLSEPALALTLGAKVLGAEELAMTAEEAVLVLGDPTRAGEVLAVSGSPAVVHAMRWASGSPAQGRGSSLAAVVESLFRVRGFAWDDEFVDFLVRICLPDGVDERIAAELSGRTDAARMLERAQNEGVGTWTSPAVESRPARFVLSPFIRYAAEQRLREQLPAGQLHALIRRIALWERSEGNPFAALRRAIDCRDLALASEIVRESWVDLLPYGASVREAFRPIPATKLRSWPLLAMLLAIIYNARAENRLRALEFFAIASYGARRQRDSGSPSDRALLRGLESAAQRVSGHADRALTAAREAYAALQELSAQERERLGRNAPIMYGHIGISFFYAGETDRALDCFRRSLTLYDAVGPIGGTQPLSLIAGALAVAGDVTDARPVVDAADQRTWPDGWRTGYPGTFFQLARAFFALEDGEPAAALQTLRTLDGTMPANEHWALLTHAEVVALLMQHRPEDAALLLERALRTQRTRHAALSLPVARLQHTRALVELARGDTAAAESAMTKSTDGPRSAVSRARIVLAEGDPARALRLLQSFSAEGVSSRLRAEHLALRTAAIALQDPGHARTAASLDRLRALLSDRGLLLPLAFVPLPGLEAMAQAGPEPWLAARVERARQLALIRPLEAARPRLTQRELAVARELTRSETVAQIAEALVVSPNTVKTQLRSLYRKLHVGSRDEAVQALAILGITAEREPSAR